MPGRGTSITRMEPRTRTGRLSAAEQQVVQHVCAGLSNAEIARALGKRIGTVKNQLSSAFRKRGVNSRARLIAQTMRGRAGRMG